jgi:hypothetical protein
LDVGASLELGAWILVLKSTPFGLARNSLTWHLPGRTLPVVTQTGKNGVIMKLTSWLLAALAAVILTLPACSKKSSVDTAPLEKSFASAEPATKSTADTAVSELKAGNYAGAMAELQKLAAQVKLTPEQQQAVKDVLAQVQQKLADSTAKVGKDAEKAAGDLQKSLPK